MGLTDELKKIYGLDRDGCLYLLVKTRQLFLEMFGDKHAFCKSILNYYSEEIFKIELAKKTEIARLDNLWEKKTIGEL